MYCRFDRAFVMSGGLPSQVTIVWPLASRGSTPVIRSTTAGGSRYSLSCRMAEKADTSTACAVMIWKMVRLPDVPRNISLLSTAMLLVVEVSAHHTIDMSAA